MAPVSGQFGNPTNSRSGRKDIPWTPPSLLPTSREPPTTSTTTLGKPKARWGTIRITQLSGSTMAPPENSTRRGLRGIMLCSTRSIPWRQQGLCFVGGSHSVFSGGCSALRREPGVAGSTLRCQRTIHGFGFVSATRDKNRTGQRQDKVTRCHDSQKSFWVFYNPLSPGTRPRFGAQHFLGSPPLHWSPLTHQPPFA